MRICYGPTFFAAGSRSHENFAAPCLYVQQDLSSRRKFEPNPVEKSKSLKLIFPVRVCHSQPIPFFDPRKLP
jgi:hypothetical protein